MIILSPKLCKRLQCRARYITLSSHEEDNFKKWRLKTFYQTFGENCKFPRKLFAIWTNPWADGARRVGRAFPKQNLCGSKHSGKVTNALGCCEICVCIRAQGAQRAICGIRSTCAEHKVLQNKTVVAVLSPERGRWQMGASKLPPDLNT